MSRWLTIKILIVILVVCVAGPGWLSAERAYQGTSPTLAAASTEATEFAVRTYKVYAPKQQANGTMILQTDLIDASRKVIGAWKESWTLDRKRTEQELTLDGTVTVMTFNAEDRSGRIVVDGEEIWAGQFTTGTPEEQARILGISTHLSKMAIIARDIGEARRSAVRLSNEWELVEFAPRVSRSAILTAFRLLSFGHPVYAAGSDGPECQTEFEHCDFAVGATRSIACAEAKLDAGGECTNWINCIGCCAWQTPDCDCACVTGDFVCTCLACGAACVIPV